MPTKKEIDLIYKHTHSDFKGIREGRKCVLYFDKDFGTCSTPIEFLPKNEFKIRLEQAKKKEKK